MQELKAKWGMYGLLAEKRELKSSKNIDWRGYVAKVQTLGSTFEVTIPTREQYDSLVPGNYYQCSGEFEEQAGRLRLIATKTEPIKGQ